MGDPVLKRLELGFRRGLISAVNRLARRPRRTGLAELPASPRILLLRHDRFGDAIVSTAIMKLLREHFPTARIDVLLGRRNRAIAPLLPAIDDTLVLESGVGGLRRIRPLLRERRYDAVVNLLAKDSSSGAILSILSGARLRVGFAGALSDVYDFAIPRPSRPLHIVSETALLLGPFGIPPVGDAPTREAEMLELVVPGALPAPSGLSDRTPSVVFSISARDDDHSWPDGNTASLVREMRADGIEIALAGVPNHRSRLEAIADVSGALILPATSSYGEFALQLSRFDIIITPQTSTVHVGSALRRPTVLLNTSSESDSQWTPWGITSRVLVGGERLSLIRVDEVAAALRSLVEELRSASSDSP